MRYEVGAQPPPGGFHVKVTVPPFTADARPVGAPGVPAHGPPPTETTTSLDGALNPLAFCARTRTKYVPGATPLAENVVAALPVRTFARFAEPLDDPASMTYDVTGSPEPDPDQMSVTELPATDAVRLLGAPGTASAATAWALRRAAEKQAGSPEELKQRAKSNAPAPKRYGAAPAVL
jgi:hypothetical protein